MQNTGSTKRLYAAVAGCAVVVYLGALWNGFAVDDVPIIVHNPLVASPSGIWRAFAAPYWPPDLGGHMSPPLVIAGFALDWLLGSTAWLQAVNLAWHAAASVAVAALARRWADWTGALVAGLLFAVHPVHVEAVANVVGRAEVMAALFTLVAVYAALVHESVAWSAAALALGLLSKENAAVAPALIVCAFAWVGALVVAWRRARKLEASGLGWPAIALLPVANLLYPAGFYLAERTLYLPSAGPVLAAAAWLARLRREQLRPVAAALVLLGGVPSALRVPVWRDDAHVTHSILLDSPQSYVGDKRT